VTIAKEEVAGKLDESEKKKITMTFEIRLKIQQTAKPN